MQLRQGITTINMEEQSILVDSAEGKVYLFEGTGREVLEQILKGTKMELLCQNLLQKYNVDAESINNDVSEFVKELMSLGLFEQDG